jgi:Signal transduction histidine kinase
VAAARRALESLVGLALERDMDLGFDPRVPSAMVRGDPTMLQELVVNLVDNALRYTPGEAWSPSASSKTARSGD